MAGVVVGAWDDEDSFSVMATKQIVPVTADRTNHPDQMRPMSSSMRLNVFLTTFASPVLIEVERGCSDHCGGFGYEFVWEVIWSAR